MASYHLSAKIVGRSDGRSAVAAAAYRSGGQFVREETGQAYDYSRKGGIVSTDLLTPADAPDWAKDRASLWNAVEAKEKRKNSQLAREIELALPNELEPDQARQLVLDWSQRELVALGMCADVCIHDPEPVAGEPRNRHAHVLCTVRHFDGGEWAKNKDRAWNDVALLERWRESWAEAQNEALRAVGSSARVDHRSLEAQMNAAIAEGDVEAAVRFDRPPEPKMGVVASGYEKRERERAAREDRAYEPVTERGAMVAESRGLRRVMQDALERVRSAVVVLRDAKEGLRALLRPVIDPFAAAAPAMSGEPVDPFAGAALSGEPVDPFSAPAAPDPTDRAADGPSPAFS